jgi:hypothetical protein
MANAGANLSRPVRLRRRSDLVDNSLITEPTSISWIVSRVLAVIFRQSPDVLIGSAVGPSRSSAVPATSSSC